MDLEQYRVGQLPTLYYIPDAISPAEEERLLREIRASKQQWKSVSGRRLQSLGGMVHKQGLIPAPLPGYLEPLLARLAADTGIYGGAGERANHVLINAYQVRHLPLLVFWGWRVGWGGLGRAGGGGRVIADTVAAGDFSYSTITRVGLPKTLHPTAGHPAGPAGLLQPGDGILPCCLA